MGSAWFIYALGGGWGHLNRAIALGRLAARQHPVQILTNSAYASSVIKHCQRRDRPSQLQFQVLPTGLDLATAHRQIQAWLLSQDCGCLIVDTFPRGLVGELATLLPQMQSVYRVLVHRDLNPDYVAAKSLTAFVSQHYDAILIPGDGTDLPLAGLKRVWQTQPWLVRNPEDLPTPAAMRSRFQLTTQAPLVLVCAAGQPIELAFWGYFTAQLTQAFPQAIVRCLAPTCPPGCPPLQWICHWPGIELLQVANVVVGGAGYNTVKECHALGVPLVTFAFPRRYDRQRKRAEAYGDWVPDETAAIAAVQHHLMQARSPRSRPPVYTNGAIAAVQWLEQAIASAGV